MDEPLPPPAVFICDDESALSTALCRSLRRAGVNAAAFSSPEQLLEAARSSRPKVILLDLHLPTIDGREVLLRLKEDPLTQDIHVVMMSGGFDAMARECCERFGAHSLVLKPFDSSFVPFVARMAASEADAGPDSGSAGG